MNVVLHIEFHRVLLQLRICFPWGFASCPYGNSFPVRWCTTSLFPSPFCTGNSLIVCWEGGPIPCAAPSPDLIALDFFCWVCKRHCLSLKSAKCEWVAWQNRQIWAAECVTSRSAWLYTWRESEYHFDVCRVTNDALNEMYWACKKFCVVVQCLKMYRSLLLTLWLNICNVLFLFI